MLCIVTEGYRLLFASPPLLQETELQSPQGAEEIKGMQEHISLMLQMKTITKVPSRFSRILLQGIPGMQSFRRVASSNRFKELNAHIYAPHFGMFTISSVLSTIRKDGYTFKIDLQTYFHVPIHPSSRKYLRFAFEAKVYQF